MIQIEIHKYMSKKTTHYRDADSGQYITQKEAEKNPKTSVKETDKSKKK